MASGKTMRDYLSPTPTYDLLREINQLDWRLDQLIQEPSIPALQEPSYHEWQPHSSFYGECERHPDQWSNVEPYYCPPPQPDPLEDTLNRFMLAQQQINADFLSQLSMLNSSIEDLLVPSPELDQPTDPWEEPCLLPEESDVLESPHMGTNYFLLMTQASMGKLPNVDNFTSLTASNDLASFDEDSSEEEWEEEHTSRNSVNDDDIVVPSLIEPIKNYTPQEPIDPIECALVAHVPLIALKESIFPVEPSLPVVSDPIILTFDEDSSDHEFDADNRSGEIVNIREPPPVEPSLSILGVMDDVKVIDFISPIPIDTIREYILPVTPTVLDIKVSNLSCVHALSCVPPPPPPSHTLDTSDFLGIDRLLASPIPCHIFMVNALKIPFDRGRRICHTLVKRPSASLYSKYLFIWLGRFQYLRNGL